MKEPNLLDRIDEYYTKAVKVIIGDLPLSELKSENYDTSTTKENIDQIKHIYSALKEEFLALGTPENEKELLYSEVKKRDKKIDHHPHTTRKDDIDHAKDIYNSLKASFLSLGTPENEKELRYEEVVKKKGIKTHTSTNKQSTNTTKKVPMNTQVKKSSESRRGAQKEAKIALYTKDIKKHYGEVDEEFLAIIVKNLGPSIYKKDAELVSCSNQKELDTVRRNFLIKKLGIDTSKGVLDAAIKDVCEELKSTRTKYRATFYYRLAKKFNKESMLS